MKVKKGFAKRLVGFAAFLIMLVILPLEVLAAIPQEVLDIRWGVVYILSIETDASYVGTGFAVGPDENNYKIITSFHVVSDSAGNLSHQLFASYGSLETEIVKVTILAYSTAHDLAVLEVSAPIPGIKPLNLSLDTLLPSMDVYALGFPGGLRNGSKEGMVLTEGVVKLISTGEMFGDKLQELKFILSNAEVAPGNSGGPLVNNTGSVVGVTMARTEKAKTGIALHVEELIIYLDSIGVAYTTIGVASTPSSTPSSTPPYSQSYSPPKPQKTDGGSAGIGVVGIVVLVVLIIFMISQRKKRAAMRYPQYGQPPQHGQPPQYGQPPQHGQPPQYGQPPQHGQPPQYGQPPQHGQPPQYGQPPQHGQPPQYGQPPQHGQPPQYGQPPQQGQPPQHGQPLVPQQSPEAHQKQQRPPRPIVPPRSGGASGRE